MPKDKIKTIALSERVYLKLYEMRRPGETFGKVIEKLLKDHENKKGRGEVSFEQDTSSPLPRNPAKVSDESKTKEVSLQ